MDLFPEIIEKRGAILWLLSLEVNLGHLGRAAASRDDKQAFDVWDKKQGLRYKFVAISIQITFKSMRLISSPRDSV